MNAQSKALKIATEIGKPENAPMIERQLLAKSFTANRAAIARSDVALHTAISNGTAHRALRILQSEIIDTAKRYRDFRIALGPDFARGHKVALLALLRVRRELRDAYPAAKPFWESGL